MPPAVHSIETATIWDCSRPNSRSYVESCLLHLEVAGVVEEQVLMLREQARNIILQSLIVNTLFTGIASVGFVG